MKIRNGFVSNSSSASFVITWQIDDELIEEGVNLFDMAFCMLFDVGSTSNWIPNFDIWKQEESVYNEIRVNTVMIDKNTFRSEFKTNMLNSPVDFGIGAAYLLLALETTSIPNSIKLLDKQINR